MSLDEVDWDELVESELQEINDDDENDAAISFDEFINLKVGSLTKHLESENLQQYESVSEEWNELMTSFKNIDDILPSDVFSEKDVCEADISNPVITTNIFDSGSTSYISIENGNLWPSLETVDDSKVISDLLCDMISSIESTLSFQSSSLVQVVAAPSVNLDVDETSLPKIFTEEDELKYYCDKVDLAVDHFYDYFALRVDRQTTSEPADDYHFMYDANLNEISSDSENFPTEIRMNRIERIENEIRRLREESAAKLLQSLFRGSIARTVTRNMRLIKQELRKMNVEDVESRTWELLYHDMVCDRERMAVEDNISRHENAKYEAEMKKQKAERSHMHEEDIAIEFRCVENIVQIINLEGINENKPLLQKELACSDCESSSTNYCVLNPDFPKESGLEAGNLVDDSCKISQNSSSSVSLSTIVPARLTLETIGSIDTSASLGDQSQFGNVRKTKFGGVIAMPNRESEITVPTMPSFTSLVSCEKDPESMFFMTQTTEIVNQFKSKLEDDNQEIVEEYDFCYDDDDDDDDDDDNNDNNDNGDEMEEEKENSRSESNSSSKSTENKKHPTRVFPNFERLFQEMIDNTQTSFEKVDISPLPEISRRDLFISSLFSSVGTFISQPKNKSDKKKRDHSLCSSFGMFLKDFKNKKHHYVEIDDLLDFVDFDHEDLQELSMNVENLVNLDFLLDGNMLRSLDLSVNKLKSASLHILSSHKNFDCLEDLKLADNQISSIEALGSIKSLRNLSLNSNQITDISPLAKLSRLVSLNVSHNKLETISGRFSNYFQRFEAANNRINSIGNEFFESSPHLSYLDLSGNLLLSFDFHCLSANNFEIQTLILSRNKILEYPRVLRLPLLRILWLSGNRITLDSKKIVTDSEYSYFLPSLEMIYLQDNLLSCFPRNFFLGCPFLTYLDISFNQFEDYSEFLSLRFCQSLRVLQCQDNPFLKNIDLESQLHAPQIDGRFFGFSVQFFFTLLCPWLSTFCNCSIQADPSKCNIASFLHQTSSDKFLKAKQLEALKNLFPNLDGGAASFAELHNDVYFGFCMDDIQIKVIRGILEKFSSLSSQVAFFKMREKARSFPPQKNNKELDLWRVYRDFHQLYFFEKYLGGVVESGIDSTYQWSSNVAFVEEDEFVSYWSKKIEEKLSRYMQVKENLLQLTQAQHGNALMIQKWFRGSYTRRKVKKIMSSICYDDDEIDSILGNEDALKSFEMDDYLSLPEMTSWVYGDHKRPKSSRRSVENTISSHPTRNSEDEYAAGTLDVEMFDDHDPYIQENSNKNSPLTQRSSISEHSDLAFTSARSDISQKSEVDYEDLDDSEWHVKDPKLAATIAKRAQRIRQISKAKEEREHNKDPIYRLEKIMKTVNSGSTNNHGNAMNTTTTVSGSFGGKPKQLRHPRKARSLPAWMLGSDEN